MKFNIDEVKELYELYVNDLSSHDNKEYKSYYDGKPFYVSFDYSLDRIFFKTIEQDQFEYVCIVSLDKFKKIIFDILRFSDDSSIDSCVSMLEKLGYDISEINYFAVLACELVGFLTIQESDVAIDSFNTQKNNFAEFEKLYNAHFEELSQKNIFNIEYMVEDNGIYFAEHNELNNTMIIKSKNNNEIVYIVKLDKFKMLIFDLINSGRMHDIKYNTNLLLQIGYSDNDVKYLLLLAMRFATALVTVKSDDQDTLTNDEILEDDDSLEEIDKRELEDINEDLILDDYSYRDLYATDHFKKYYMNAPEEQKQYIDDILYNFKTCKTQDELNNYLYRKNNKKLKSSRLNVDKIYVDNNSGHRLVWSFMSNFSSEYPKGSIIFMEYIKVHDDQNKVAHKLRKSDLASIIKLCDNTGKSVSMKQESIPPYKYYNNVWIPQLTVEQQMTTLVQPPALIYGCAGSGKTLVSIELFNHFLTNKEDVYYITYSQDLVEKVRKDLSIQSSHDINVINDRVMTIRNYFLEKLGINKNEINFVDFAVFDEWKNNNYLKKSQNKYRKLDSEFVWTYIKGIIKGEGPKAKAKDNFISLMVKKEGIDSDIAGLVYDVYVDYQLFIEGKTNTSNIFGAKKAKFDIYDDNDLAKKVMEQENLFASESMLIVDEVQDLTYLQIMALNYVVKNANIIMCGDGNQRINPTIIDLNSIERIFYQNDSYGRDFEYINLPHSFRSSYGIIVFLNHLSNIRRKYIALQDSKYEIKEISIRNSGEGLWPIYCDKQNVDFSQVCRLAADSANSIIIVPNESVKEDLINRNPILDGRVMDIQQVKGLEYDNVIIYDFVSAYKNEFIKIVNNEKTRDTFGRLLFNYLYVACTRAKESLIICENDCDIELQNIIYKDIGVQTSYDTIHSIVMLEEDDDSWYAEAKRLEDCKEYRMAINAYQKIKNRDCSLDVQRCGIMQQVKELENMRDVDNKIEKIKGYGQQLLDLKQWEAALNCYTKCEEDSIDHEIYIENIYLNSILKKRMDRKYVKRYMREYLKNENPDKLYMLIPYMEESIKETKKMINDLDRSGK